MRILNALNNIITNRLKKKPCLKRVRGIITEFVMKTDFTGREHVTGKYKVRIAIDQDEIDKLEHDIKEGIEIDTSNDLILINKSNDAFYLGCPVWVHYWNTPSDGYIALMIGRSRPPARPEEPYYAVLDIDDLYIIE